MSDELRGSLLRQLDIAWKLASLHLDGLTTDECLWRPAARGLHVHRAGDGAWRADWPDREDYDIGPPSIAWLTWHIGYWWSMVLDHSFGDGTLTREQVAWPGSADEVRRWITGLQERWRQAVGALRDDDLRSTARTRWPFRDRPFGDVIAWVNVELTKNAAEMGYARFLYAVRAEEAPQGEPRMVVRRARAGDAPTLSRFAGRVFHEAFGADNSPDDLASYMAEAFTAERQAAEIADPDSTVLLVEDFGDGGQAMMVGYAHIKAGTVPAAVTGPDPLELKRFYVDAPHHGRGVARRLMAEVLRAAAHRGARTLWLGVWEHNARAIAFYRKHGFERVGEHDFVLGRDRQTDWLMARPIEPEDAS